MGLDEFDRIKKYFRPLASIERGSLNLLDDAAVLPVDDASKIVISTDALVEGIHFFGEEEVDLIAQKSLRTNLSDMAAMGATPWVYTLSLSLGPVTKGTLDQWLASFVKGLKKDQDKYDVRLIGGDTVTGSGPTVVSITILGRADPRGVITRNGASVYDDIYVSMKTGKPYSVSHQDCLQSIRLLHSFYRSDEKNNWQEVNEDGESIRLGRENNEISNLYRTKR